MDAIERVRVAGTIVEILTAMGCSGEDIRGIADAVGKHLLIQAKEPFTPSAILHPSLIGPKN